MTAKAQLFAEYTFGKSTAEKRGPLSGRLRKYLPFCDNVNLLSPANLFGFFYQFAFSLLVPLRRLSGLGCIFVDSRTTGCDFFFRNANCARCRLLMCRLNSCCCRRYWTIFSYEWTLFVYISLFIHPMLFHPYSVVYALWLYICTLMIILHSLHSFLLIAQYADTNRMHFQRNSLDFPMQRKCETSEELKSDIRYKWRRE